MIEPSIMKELSVSFPLIGKPLISLQSVNAVPLSEYYPFLMLIWLKTTSLAKARIFTMFRIPSGVFFFFGDKKLKNEFSKVSELVLLCYLRIKILLHFVSDMSFVTINPSKECQTHKINFDL